MTLDTKSEQALQSLFEQLKAAENGSTQEQADQAVRACNRQPGTCSADSCCLDSDIDHRAQNFD